MTATEIDRVGHSKSSRRRAGHLLMRCGARLPQRYTGFGKQAAVSPNAAIRPTIIYDALFAWLRFAADERHNWPAKAA
ncbi:MAG TPA: hypothetical protein VI251_04350 [Pseudolabrys sp.]